MSRSPSCIRDRVAVSATMALLLVSACSGGGEPESPRAQPARETPPVTREPAPSTRETPGPTRELPGGGREPPVGSSDAPGGGSACLTCGQYECEVSDHGETSKSPLVLDQVGSECGGVIPGATIVFHCGGAITYSGNAWVRATRWTPLAGGGFVLTGENLTAVCKPDDSTPRTPEDVAAPAR